MEFAIAIALAMEYVSAFYPLLLTVVAYITIELHACGFRPIMWCWKPFHKCYVKFWKTTDSRGSVINAFAVLHQTDIHINQYVSLYSNP